MPENFDQPLDKRRRTFRRNRVDSDATGIIAERIARFTGTPRFIIWLTLFVFLWIAWNSFGPESLRFDSAALGFTAPRMRPRSRAATRRSRSKAPRSPIWRRALRLLVRFPVKRIADGALIAGFEDYH